MVEKTLSKNTKSSLELLGASGLLKDAYLAGGTALALQIGHRVSVDLDFFTRKEFNERLLLSGLVKLSKDFKLERSSNDTILGNIKGVRFSLFFYNYPLLAPPKKFLKINILTVQDIAPMKLSAISSRGTKRDFIDLYFIAAVEKILTLEEVFYLYERKFKSLKQNKTHLLKSLVYFRDADQDAMPEMIKKMEWAEAKSFFENEVYRLTRRGLV